MASNLLLGVYLAVLGVVSGWSYALEQFETFWPFVLALSAGFGIQVAFYLHLRHVARHQDASGKMVAVAGGTSSAAMVSCCTHYLTNLLPALGTAGVVTLVGQYQVELFWVALAFNVTGVLYVGRRAIQASRHMAQMAQDGH